MLNWLEVALAHFTTVELITIGCTIAAATMLQAAVGFGFNLLAIPILLRCGLELPEAIVVSIVAQMWQQGAGYWHTHQAVVWRPLVPVIVAMAVCLVAGVMLQGTLAGWDKTSIRRLVGGLILAGLLAQWYWKPKPRAHLPAGWGVLAGACGGLLGGLAGVPGPPLVMWVMAHDWSNQRTRGSIWAMFLFLTPLLFVILWISKGNEMLVVLLPSVALIPVVQLSAMAGMRMGNAMSKQRLRRIAFALLLIIAVAAIAGV